MKKTNLIAVALSLFVMSSLGFAKTKPKDEFSVEKIQAKYKKSESISADFHQEVYQAALGRTKTSKGHLSLSKPNLIRWEIDEPESSIMVSNGRKLSYFTPDAKGKGKGQVIEKKPKEVEKQALFKILTGASALTKEFKILKTTPSEDSKGVEKSTLLELKPINAMGDTDTVTLKISANYLIQEVLIVNQAGNKTKIALQNQELGDKLPAALFDFHPPQGTEVVKE